MVDSGNKRVESVWVPVFVQPKVLLDVPTEELNQSILSEIGFKVDDGEFIIEVEFELGNAFLNFGIDPSIGLLRQVEGGVRVCVGSVWGI